MTGVSGGDHHAQFNLDLRTPLAGACSASLRARHSPTDHTSGNLHSPNKQGGSSRGALRLPRSASQHLRPLGANTQNLKTMAPPYVPTLGPSSPVTQSSRFTRPLSLDLLPSVQYPVWRPSMEREFFFPLCSASVAVAHGLPRSMGPLLIGVIICAV